MPLVFGHGSTVEIGQRSRTCTWCLGTATTLGPRPSVLAATLRAESCPGVVEEEPGLGFRGNKPAATLLAGVCCEIWRSRSDLHRHSSRRQRVAFLFSYGSCFKMVGGAGNAPVVTSDFICRHRFYRPAAGTPPMANGSGDRNHTCLSGL